MCGDGGNTIQFAKAGFNTTAVDINPSKIANLKIIAEA